MSTLPGPTATHQHTGEQPQLKRRRPGWKPLLAIIGGVVAVAVAASAVLIWLNLRHPGLPEIPETPYEVHGSSEVVRYIAAHLVNHETVIDITAFYQEPEERVFIDHFGAFKEANAQNPLVLEAYLDGDSVHYPEDAVWPEDSEYPPAPDRVILEIHYGEPSAEKYAASQEELKKAAEDALTELGIDGRSDAEKATVINDWVIDHASYDDASATIQNDNVYGDGSGTGVARGSRDARGVLFTGAAMCGGYADAFLLLAHEAGLEAVTVTGTIVPSDTDHAWNRVRVDGEWLSLDPTWNDDDKGGTRNEYLLLSEPDGYTGKAERVPDGDWVRKGSRELYETGR